MRMRTEERLMAWACELASGEFGRGLLPTLDTRGAVAMDARKLRDAQLQLAGLDLLGVLNTGMPRRTSHD